MRILVPLDGSFESESALRYAAMIAPGLHAELELLLCVEPAEEAHGLSGLSHLSGDVLASLCLDEKLATYLEDKQRELGAIPNHLLTERGDPSALILNRAEQADLVVISRFGRRGIGEGSIGSVSGKVARGCRKPVLVVASPHASPRLEKIMVCLDGSELAEMALSQCANLARAVGAKIILYRFVPPALGLSGSQKDLDEAGAYLARVARDYDDLVNEVIVRHSDVTGRIESSAAELGADLVVVGSAGHQGVARWVLGSVAEQALLNARTSFMIVHQDIDALPVGAPSQSASQLAGPREHRL